MLGKVGGYGGFVPADTTGARPIMTDDTKTSFEKDIRPMFTDTDVDHMKAFDLDLSSRDDVQKHAAEIYETVTGGTMPPPLFV